MLSFSLPQLISLSIVLVVGLTIHEFAHAWTADYFGDDTPRLNDRLTLNPLAHLDVPGSIPLLITVILLPIMKIPVVEWLVSRPAIWIANLTA
jgi:Zn-dependent protease